MNTVSTSLDVKDAVLLKQYNDDVDLLGIIGSIGKIWKQWFVSLVLVAMVFSVYAIMLYLKASKVPVYRKAIEFTFPGVEDNQYPNGTHFSLDDLIAPIIVNEVYNINKLSEYGVTVEQFRSALTVEPFVPEYFMIIKKYEKKLSAGLRLKVPEIAQLQEQLAAELSVAKKGAALISLYLNKMSMPETVIEKVVTQIPAVWARRAVKEKGVLKLNIKLATSRSIDKDLSQQIDYMLISDYLAQKARLVEGNIEKLQQLSDAALVVDDQTGLTLTDVQQELNDLKFYVIDEVMSPIRTLGLSRNVDMALYYYENKKVTLENRLKLLINQADLVKTTLDNYSPGKQGSRNVSEVSAKGTYNQQFSSGAIDKIMSLSSDLKSEEFRQSLNERWLNLKMQQSNLRHETGKVSRLIAALKNTESNAESISIKEQYLTRAEKKMPEVLEKLKEYLDVTQRIYLKLSEENIGVNGHLYRQLSNKPYLKSFDFSVKKMGVIFVALLILASIVIVPVLMIRNALKNRARLAAE